MAFAFRLPTLAQAVIITVALVFASFGAGLIHAALGAPLAFQDAYVVVMLGLSIIGLGACIASLLSEHGYLIGFFLAASATCLFEVSALAINRAAELQHLKLWLPTLYYFFFG